MAVLGIALLCGVGVFAQSEDAARAQSAGQRQAYLRTGRAVGKPAYLWLWYADGNAMPTDSPYCSGFRPPAFTCSYGTSVEDCQRQVQAYLDPWYADFNLVFSLTRPTNGDYYTVIISSSGTWCMQDPVEAGVAPFNCNDNPNATAFAFECGASAHACATMIAHEHGHLVGLEHSTDTNDVMYPKVLASAAGFDNASNFTVEGICQPSQNSYQQMLTALGSWPGGSKPSALADLPDAGAADSAGLVDAAEAVDATSGGGSVYGSGSGSSSDGGVAAISGFDAFARQPPQTVDARVGDASGSSHGCDLAHAMRGNAGPAEWLPLVALLFWLRFAGREQLPARARPHAPRRP